MTQLALTLTPPSRGPEHARLSAQNAAIVQRLLQGPATNHELSQLALNYRARISEIRKAGWVLKIQSRDYDTGRVVYVLEAA